MIPVHFPADEEWMELPGNPRYLISTHGRVYALGSRTILAPYWDPAQVRNGRMNYQGSLKVSIYVRRGEANRRSCISLASEVLKVFAPAPYDVARPTVNYIDGDRTNVRLDNLEWVEQRAGAVDPEHLRRISKLGYANSPVARSHTRRGGGQPRFDPDEEWLELPQHHSYLISTHGRVYSLITRHVMTPHMTKRDQTLAVTVGNASDPEGKQTVMVAPTVLRVFVGEGFRPKQKVNYHDGDRTNVRLDNLSWGRQHVPGSPPQHMARMREVKAARRNRHKVDA